MSASNRCKECGTAIPADSAGGWCPPCLFALGLKGAEVAAEEELAGEAGEQQASAARASEKGSNILNARLTEQPGDRIGRYRLLQEIGHGGCGVVYMAEQEEPVRRKVALKVIKLGMDTRQVVARFEAERQALALMDHPNIAKVLDAGATDAGRPYFVMELVGGIKITEYCDQHHLTTRQRLDLFIQVCRAIQHAHQKGIIHRDLKPSNVLVTTHDGTPVPKVIDFGIAKATQGRLTNHTLFTAFEQFIGTPAYMSPEQAQLGGLDVDTRSDIYSLGVLLYELLTGKIPFDTEKMLAGGLDEIRRTIREQEPSPPSTCLGAMAKGELIAIAEHRQSDAPKLIHLLRGDLDWIVMKCLDKDRDRRYETANALAMDIERHLKNEPVLARPPSRIYSLRKLYRRNRLVVTAGALILFVGMMGGSGILWQWGSAKQHAMLEHKERGRAEQATERALATLAGMEAIEVRRAEEYYQAGDWRNMVPYLSLVLRQNPSNQVAAERLFSTLSHRHWARLACPPLLHSNRVTSAMFSRDGRWVVTSSADNTARVWDSDSGAAVSAPMRHSAEINTAEFSPDGKLVVTASDDHTVRVWDARTGRPVTEALAHPARVEMARFSPDSRTLVTLCDDRYARLWDSHTSNVLHSFNHGDGPGIRRFFRESDFSPDGALLVTASKDGTVRVWNCRTGELANKLEWGQSETTCVRFSPDGQRLAASFYANSPVIWNLRSKPPQLLSLHQDGPLTSIEFSPEGQRVVTASSAGMVQVWNVESGTAIGPPLHHSDNVQSAMFSPEGLRVVTASGDGTIRVWDAETGESLSEPMRMENGAYYAQFHPDGQRVLSVSNGNAVLIWWVTGSVSAAFHEPFRVSVLDFSKDSAKVVVGLDDGSLQVWEPLTGRVRTFSAQHASAVASAAFSSNGSYVATVSDDGTARVWSVQRGEPIAGPLQWGAAGRRFEVHFSPDDRQVLTISEYETARLWDSMNGESKSPALGEGDGVMTAQFSPDGKWVVTGGTNNTARIWESATGRAAGSIMRHDSAVLEVCFSPDSKQLVTGSRDKTARLWAVPSGRSLAAPIQHSLDLSTVRFSPEGARFLTAVPDQISVRVWDYRSTKLLTEVMALDSDLADFTGDGRRIATGATLGNRPFQLWDTQSGERLSEPLVQKGRVNVFRLSPDGRFLATVCSDGLARFWEITPASLPVPPWLPAVAEGLAGQRFNQEGRLVLVSPLELWTVQQKLAQVSAGLGEGPELYSRWAKWFISPPNSRPILPSSSVTVAEHVDRLAKTAGARAGLKEALLLQPSNAIAMARFGETATNNLQADWLTWRAMEQIPLRPWTLVAREGVLQRSGRFAEALALLEQHPSLWTNIPWIWGRKGEMFDKLDQLEDALDAYTQAAITVARTSDPKTSAHDRRLRKDFLDHALLQRRRLLKRLNRLAELQADSLEGKHIPGCAPRPPGQLRFTLIDLRRQLNQSLEDFRLTRTMGATNSTAPVKWLAGVEFELCGYINLDQGGADPAFPFKAEGIQVAQRCRVLHLLQSCTPVRDSRHGAVIGAYLVHYADGGQEKIPIVYGENVRNWSDVEGQLSQASDGWVGRNDHGESLRLIKFSWQNPRPEAEVQTIDFITDNGESNPILFAITLER
jgi:WD40 repeat protein/serine/threonine protein kinase/tetratricopeptide (TPR) repeat protein